MHDALPHIPDTDYFFLGNGRIMVAIQWSRHEAASPYGILLCDPERMSRKHGSLLFHPELGLARTMLSVVVDGRRHRPRHEDVHVAWQLAPAAAVVVTWRAGTLAVRERFTIADSSSALVRDVTVTGTDGRTLGIEAALYANPLFFDEFGTRASREIYASGYAAINLYAVGAARSFERFLTVDATSIGGIATASFVYTVEAVGTHEFSLYPDDRGSPRTAELPVESPDEASAEVRATLAERIIHQYHIARASLRACVSVLGKFDAAIWQYDFEWGLDAAMVATAAALSGQFEVSRAVLTNILRRLSNSIGMITEASRFRGGEMAELNGNGAVLDALWHYWRFSGDTALLRSHWDRIAAIAEYPLREEFQHESGLLVGRRDFWERTPWMGVGRGFELGHQVFVAAGLRRAAAMASALGHESSALRWGTAAERIREAMLHHPTHALVADGRFIRRRLVAGTVQRTMTPDTTYEDPDYAPYVPEQPSDRGEAPCEPDVTEVLPLLYELVDASAPEIAATLEALEALWNPTGTGGYARYNIASDPDSPGPWPFATAFMAAAQIEAGLNERAERTIAWLLESAGAGGSWFEYYGERRSPPHPPIGIIVWGWAQFVILVMRHLLGVRVREDTLSIRPRMVGLDHHLRMGEHSVHIVVGGLGAVLVDGHPVALHDGAVHLALPLAADHSIAFTE